MTQRWARVKPYDINLDTQGAYSRCWKDLIYRNIKFVKVYKDPGTNKLFVNTPIAWYFNISPDDVYVLIHPHKGNII